MKYKRSVGNALLCLGAVLLLCALGLFLHNQQEQKRAGEASAALLRRLNAEIMDDKGNSLSDVVYKQNPEVEMPVVYVDGVACVGTLQIPTLGLELPVWSAWSYDGLKTAPCRYAGSVYLDNMVIAAHNYLSHFGRLHTLAVGDPVLFTDTDGHVFSFSVAAVEILSPYSVRAMKESEWPLTLFTCTYGGQYRVTVRCVRDER